MKNNGIHFYIYQTAEYILFGYLMRKYLWANAETDWTQKNDYFHVKIIRNICIVHLIITIVLAAFNSVVFWYTPSKIALNIPEFYFGVIISVVLAICSFFSVKHIQDYVVSHSANKMTGLKNAYYINMSINLAFFLLVFALPIFLMNIPFVFFALYYMFFYMLFTSIILMIYLVMRIRNKNYSVDLGTIR